MAKNNRIAMMQKSQARLMRARPPKPKRESAAEEMREPLGAETAESPEFERREHGGSAPHRIPRSVTVGGRP
jgi:hypothetical protein